MFIIWANIQWNTQILKQKVVSALKNRKCFTTKRQHLLAMFDFYIKLIRQNFPVSFHSVSSSWSSKVFKPSHSLKVSDSLCVAFSQILLKLYDVYRASVFYCCTAPSDGDILFILCIILETFSQNSIWHVWCFLETFGLSATII